MNTVELLFNLLSILYLFRSVQVGVTAYRNWQAVNAGPFTPQMKQLAEQASFFVAVPVAVFFHELAHALAIWAFGGRVVEFGYRFFWGYVLPQGNFTAAEDWFISLAGTLGSLIAGYAFWLALRGSPSPTLSYFGLRSFRYQILFSIVLYPLFTLLGFYGDWRTVYDFGATPYLSGGTAALHAISLGVFLWAERIGRFESAAFRSAEDQARLGDLERQAEANLHDPEAQMRLIQAYRQGGDFKRAQLLLRDFLKDNPHSADGHLEMTMVQAWKEGRVTRSARDHASEALRLGLSRPERVAVAHRYVGDYELEVGRLENAVDAYNDALEAAGPSDIIPLKADIYYRRALAFRRLGKFENAYKDIRQAITLSGENTHKQVRDLYQLELETIRKHARDDLNFSQ